MACGGFCGLVSVLLLLVAVLALNVISLVTDYWYLVETNGLVTVEEDRANNYHFGFWRRCYDTFPTGLMEDDDRSGDDCLLTYKDLLPKSESNLTNKQKIVMHLSRSYIGLSITSGAFLLATILVLLCGSMPGRCNKVRKSGIYIGSTLVLLIATMAGIACGVCFIAAREVEEEDLDLYNGMDTDYGWSFMLHWIGTGLSLLIGFVLVCMLRYSYEDVAEDTKFFYNDM